MWCLCWVRISSFPFWIRILNALCWGVFFHFSTDLSAKGSSSPLFCTISLNQKGPFSRKSLRRQRWQTCYYLHFKILWFSILLSCKLTQNYEHRLSQFWRFSIYLLQQSEQSWKRDLSASRQRKTKIVETKIKSLLNSLPPPSQQKTVFFHSQSYV